MRRTRVWRAAVVVVALASVASVAGCGGGDGADRETTGPSGSESSATQTVPTESPSTTPPGTPSETPSATEPPTDEPGPTGSPTGPPTDFATPPPADGAITVTGVPEPGVEAGCLLLEGYLLLGGEAKNADLLSTGQRVHVTGHQEKDVMTTCQQGIPFRVESVELAE